MRKVGCSILTLSLPRARLFNREPYVVGFFATEDAEIHFSCEPLRGIRRNRPFAGYISLLKPVMVSGHVTGRIEVWESDSDFRNFGEKLNVARRSIESRRILKNLADSAGALAVGPAKIGIIQAAAVVGYFLGEKKDDRMASFDVELDYDDLHPGMAYTLSSPRAVVQLLITQDGDEDDEPAQETTGPSVVNHVLPVTQPEESTDDVVESKGQFIEIDGSRFFLPSGDPDAVGKLVAMDFADQSLMDAFRSWYSRDGSLDGLQAFVMRWSAG